MSTIKAVKTQEGAKNAHVLVTHVDSKAETPTEHSSAKATGEQKPDDFVYSHGLDDQGMRVTAPSTRVTCALSVLNKDSL